MTARNPKATAVVLETFQTYYAVFRAVNLSFHTLTQGARNMPLQLALPPFSARKGSGAFEFIKDLVLEVPRFPLTYRSALSPISSPVARAAYLRPSTT